MTDDQPTFAMAADPLVGRVLDGRYRIVQRLAKGGMGRVYLAEQIGLERTVAIKVLWSEDSPHSEEFRERFFREARLCSRLTHPNTVRIYDYGRTDDEVYYIAMEYLHGATLGEILREGRLEPLRAVTLAAQVCASLAEAHSLGLIHRDLKPDNLIVTQHGDGRDFVRVLDFGIAKDTHGADAPTQQGVVFGSPGYMSPEQLLEQPITPRSDLYSLGAILYRMLTGAKPFGDDAMAALTRQVTAPPKPFAETAPDLAPQPLLEWVTLRCLSRDPAGRFATVAELARALTVCELSLRGFLALPRLPELRAGELVLPPAVLEVLARFEAGTGPTPAPSVRVERPAEPTLPPDTRSQPLLELSQRLRHPAVLVVGGLGSMVIVPVGLVLLLLLLVGLQWIGAEPRSAAPAGIEGPAPAPVRPAPAPSRSRRPRDEADEDADPGDEVAPSEPPAPAPRRRVRPAPTVRPAPAADPAPVDGPDTPAPDPAVPRSDLRDPFADPR
ncbi:MAG: serine/threonine-protein kinase [Myxococcota bacterium]